jgi:hypothetical protein
MDERGEPLSDCRLRVSRFFEDRSYAHAETSTGAGGRYRLEAPVHDDGTVSVSARSEGLVLPSPRADVTGKDRHGSGAFVPLRIPGGGHALDLTARRLPLVDGRVLDFDTKKPIAGVLVEGLPLWPETPYLGPQPQERSDGAGRFTIYVTDEGPISFTCTAPDMGRTSQEGEMAIGCFADRAMVFSVARGSGLHGVTLWMRRSAPEAR